MPSSCSQPCSNCRSPRFTRALTSRDSEPGGQRLLHARVQLPAGRAKPRARRSTSAAVPDASDAFGISSSRRTKSRSARRVRLDIDRQDVGIRQPQRHRSPELAHQPVIAESGIADVLDPVVAVVGRVIHAVRPVEAHLDDRQPDVVDEDGVIRSAADPRGRQRLVRQQAILWARRDPRRGGATRRRASRRRDRSAPW